MIRTYRKYIAENRGLVYVSTFLFILLRTGFLFTTGYHPEDNSDKILATVLPFLFTNQYILFGCSLVLSFFIAFQLAFLNHKYTLIRGKTSLPYVFTLFLLGASPDYIYRISPYIGAIVVLLAIHILFASYHQPKTASRQAFGIGFILGAASLAFQGLLWYLLIFWVGFSMMRSFSFKAFLASLLAVAMIYWLQSFYIIYTHGIEGFLSEFTQGWERFYLPDILPSGKTESIILGAIYALIVLAAIFNGYIRKFDDKIQVRTNFSFLHRLLLFSLILYLLFLHYTTMNLIIILIISGFVLSHFFALANKKWKVYFFILLFVLYFANYARLIFPVPFPNNFPFGNI